MKNLLLKIDFGIDVESRDWKINKLLKKKVLIVLIVSRLDRFLNRHISIRSCLASVKNGTAATA